MIPFLIAGFALLFIVQAVCLVGLWWTTTELKAMQKSTHSVQFVPADSQFQKMTEEVKETLQKDIFDNLA
jgi:hypothetical protein